ncbi:MAG: fasciclin domain-containing protein [Bacteroidaceae bacterium]|nr:fasciclin domain-containing protein [Bacteroidaceae bacterium]
MKKWNFILRFLAMPKLKQASLWPFGLAKTFLSKSCIVVLLIALMQAGCIESIDNQNRYTFIGQTVADYLKEHEETFSSFLYILQRGGALSLMKAYGTYTCFAPTNESVSRYLAEMDSIWRNSLGTERVIWTGITSPELEELSDSMCEVISKTHIIPSKYLTIDMGGDVIPTKNLNNRYLTMTYGVNENGRGILIVNGATIILGDQEAENGVVHVVNKVLSPSSNTLPAELENMPFFSLFYEALMRTGLDMKMQNYEDYDYDDAEKTGPPWYSGAGAAFNCCPATHNYGYTAFVEPDEVYNKAGIFSLDDLYERCRVWYPNATDEDFTSPDNALNKFVSYHLLERKLLFTRLVCYNIFNAYYNSEENMLSNSDRISYYETMQGTLLMVARPLSNVDYKRNVLLNYSPELTNKKDVLHSVSTNGIPVNICVSEPSEILADKQNYPDYTQETLNGSILIINNLLIYDEDTMVGHVLNRLMRFNFSALVPEFASNDIMWHERYTSGLLNSDGLIIPHDYSKNVKFYDEESRFYYVNPYNTYCNFEGDEMQGQGPFDFAYKLPPVPPGTYEIRLGYTAYSYRNIIQMYVDNEITGLPVDLRILADDPRIGWKSDAETDDDGIANDKAMKNRGYLKGPTTYKSRTIDIARNFQNSIRKVITTKYLGDGEHWLRFKNVNENDDGKGMFMHDYLEIVPIGWMRREDIPESEKRK